MRSRIHRYIYLFLLCALAASMTTSVFFANMAWVFLFANWVFEWNWREKFSGFRHNRPLHLFLVAAAVTLLWSLGTDDLPHTLFILQIGLPFLAIPLVVLTSAPLKRREALAVAVCYVGAVTVMALVGLLRYLSIPDLPHRDIVPHISHIRFGLNLCFCIAILLSSLNFRKTPILSVLSLFLVVFFIAFLFLIQVYTGIIILLVLTLVMPIACWRRFSPITRWTALAAGIAAWLLLIAATLFYHHEYYSLRAPSTNSPRPALTANGNPYLHRDDGLIENGNYVHQYVCEGEMRSQWQKRSDYPFDSLTPVGYTVYPALLRYLNAIGATKDSLGMTQLTPADIDAIEQGIANPVYLQRGPRKLFYVLFYEYENYRCFRSVSNFSTLQRLELWRAGWTMHTRRPLLGYGTGGIQHDLQLELLKSQSPLADSDFHLHNQYLTFLVAFGWVGFLLIAFFFLRLFWRRPASSPAPSSGTSPAPSSASSPAPFLPTILLTAHIVIVIVSFLADNTLSTLAGITFVVFPFSLLSFSLLPTPNTPHPY